MPTRRATIGLALLLTAACSAPSQRLPHPPMRAPVEINLVGFENAPKPGPDRLNYEYILPTDATLGYFARKGFKTIRFPMSWNRLQPTVNGPLAPDKLADVDAFLDRVDRHGMVAIADLHAFGRRDDHPLGSPELPIATLASFWSQFAGHFKGRFAGYDIMNEPHDMPTPQVWPQAAQLTTDAIRKVDSETPIYIEGDGWSSAANWRNVNDTLDIRDPANRIVYSAHIYFDKDTSGQYRLPLAQDGASPAVARERLQPFVDWLRAHGKKGHIGEFGAPYADPGWRPVLDGFLDAVVDNRDVIGGVSYWAAGDWMDFYALTLQPDEDGKWTDRPQLETLIRKR